MSIDFQSTGPLIVQFPRYAGGKFLVNCMSLSRYACPQDPTSIEYLISNPDDYDCRFACVMKTLPPSVNQMHEWIPKFEFGDHQVYGKVYQNWITGTLPSDEVGNLVEPISKSGLRYFLTSHGGSNTVNNLLHIWPNSQVLMLINYSKFSSISYKLKGIGTKTYLDHAGNYCKEQYLQIAGTSWPCWKDFEETGYDVRQFGHLSPGIINEITQFYPLVNLQDTILFDIDSCIFDQDKFLQSVSVLYNKLQFDDFNADLVGRFWQSYIALHVDIS